MNRRAFITLIGSAAAWPLAARAQRPERVRRIGVLMALDEADPQAKVWLSRLTQGLSELGWTDGRNLRMDVRWPGDNVDRMRTLAKELVEQQPEVIFASSTPVTAALQQATRTIPIIFVIVSDPVGAGFVASLPHPGGNVTGFLYTEAEIGGKWLELLTQIEPGIRRAAMIFNPDTAPRGGTYYMPDFEAAARLFKVAPVAAPVRSVAEIETVVTALGREPRGGLIVMPDFFVFTHRASIMSLAAQNGVPAVYPWREVPAAGGLLSYGPDLADIVLGAAPYVDRILRGANPADLPVQAPTKYELVINLKTAKALGLTIPDKVLALANQVIE